MSLWSDPYLQNLFLADTPLIDVRAEIEHQEGAIPNSVNLPIMRNEERVLVGTCYKEHGQEAAIQLGHKLVCGELKSERIMAWKDYIEKNPKAEVFCFRGGLRSQISCQWLREIGIHRQPVEGGYKKMRKFFLSVLEEAPLPEFIQLSGPTGSGKTNLLKRFRHSIDLEECANHRGSAFGARGRQPSQTTFENLVALKLLKHQGMKVIVEDESATIGKVVIPKRLYAQLRNSPLISLQVSMEERISNIYEGYVAGSSKDFFISGLGQIHKSLGGLNYKLIKEKMEKAFEADANLSKHSEWIELLLKLYYDPLYLKDLQRQPGKLLLAGSLDEILGSPLLKGLTGPKF